MSTWALLGPFKQELRRMDRIMKSAKKKGIYRKREESYLEEAVFLACGLEDAGTNYCDNLVVVAPVPHFWMLLN